MYKFRIDTKNHEEYNVGLNLTVISVNRTTGEITAEQGNYLYTSSKYKAGDKILFENKEYIVETINSLYCKEVLCSREGSYSYIPENDSELVKEKTVFRKGDMVAVGDNKYYCPVGEYAVILVQPINSVEYRLLLDNGYSVSSTDCRLLRSFFSAPMSVVASQQQNSSSFVHNIVPVVQEQSKHECVCDFLLQVLPYGCKCGGV